MDPTRDRTGTAPLFSDGQRVRVRRHVRYNATFAGQTGEVTLAEGGRVHVSFGWAEAIFTPRQLEPAPRGPAAT